MMRQYWLPISTVLAFAVSLPMFDALVGNPTFFVVRDFDFAGLVIFTLAWIAVSFVVPWLIFTVLRFVVPRAQQQVFYFVFALGVGLICLPGVSRLCAPSVLLPIMISVALGASVAWCYAVSARLRELCGWFALIHVFLPIWVLFASPVAAVTQNTSIYSEHHDQDAPPSYPPIIVLLFDELPLASLLDRDLDIDQQLFPNFARFAEQSTWYRNAVAVADYTKFAIPSLLRGRYVDGETVPQQFHPSRPTLFSELLPHYDIVVEEPYTRLCPSACLDLAQPAPQSQWRHLQERMHDAAIVFAHMSLPQALMKNAPDLIKIWSNQLRRPSEPDRFVRMMAALQDFAQNDMLFWHSKHPHHGFMLLPNGYRYTAFDGVPEGQFNRPMDGVQITDGEQSRFIWESEWAALQGLQRHLLQVGYVDRYFGAILGELQRHDVFDDALVIVMSDHGMKFRAHEDARYMGANAGAKDAAIRHIPLLVKYPGQDAAIVDNGPASILDVFPTVMDVLQLSSAAHMEGRSLRRPPAERAAVEYIIDDQQAKHRVPLSEIADVKADALQKYHTFPLGRSRSMLADVLQLDSVSELRGANVDAYVQHAEAGSVKLFRAQDGHNTTVAEPLFGLFAQQRVPVRLKGELLIEPSGHSGPQHLAIVQHGKILAVTQSYAPVEDRVFFSTLLAPQQLHAIEGLSVYLVDTHAGVPSLSPLVTSVVDVATETHSQ